MTGPPEPAGKRSAGGRIGLGQLGERLAADHLERHGYQILARNVRYRFGEIDLVVRQADTLACVEVRTRRGDAYGDPVATITGRKRASLLQSALAYYHGLADPPPCLRIDLIAVRFDGSGRFLDLEHLENIVEG